MNIIKIFVILLLWTPSQWTLANQPNRCTSIKSTSLISDVALELSGTERHQVVRISHSDRDLNLDVAVGKATSRFGSLLAGSGYDWLVIEPGQSAVLVARQVSGRAQTKQPIEIYECDPELADAIAMLSDGAFDFAAGAFESAVHHSKAAAKKLDQLGEASLLASAFNMGARAAYWMEDTNSAVKLLHKALNHNQGREPLASALALLRIELLLEQQRDALTAAAVNDLSRLALTLKEQDRPLLHAQVVNTQGLVKRKMGAYQAAIPLFKEAATLFRKQNDVVRELTAAQNAALIQIEQRRELSDAVQTYATLLETLTGALNEQSPIFKDLYISMARNKALGHQRLGEYQKAITVNLELMERFPRYRRIGRLKQAVGAAYLELGDYEKARSYLEDARRTHVQEDDRLSQSVTASSLARIAKMEGHFGESAVLLAEAAEKAPTDRIKHTAILDLAIAQRETTSESSTPPPLANLQTEDPIVRAKQLHLKALQAQHEEPAKAGALFQQLLSELKEYPAVPMELAEGASAYASFLSRNNQREEVISVLEDSLRHLDAQYARIANAALRARFLAAQQGLADMLIASYLALQHHESDLKALVTLESMRARNLHGSLQNAIMNAQGNDELTAQYALIGSLTEQLAFSQTDPIEVADLEVKLRNARTKLDTIAPTHQYSPPDRSSIEQDIREMIGTLGADETVLSYWMSENNARVWILRRNAIKIEDLGDAATISDLTTELSRLLSQPPSKKGAASRVREIGAELSTKVLPAEVAVSPNSTIYVVADGPLHEIPFVVLLKSQKQRTLRAGGFRYPASVAMAKTTPSKNSFRSIKLLRTRAQGLMSAKHEARNVADIASSAGWVFDEITPSRFRLASFANDIVHIATHGVSDSVVPGRSHLVLDDRTGLRLSAHEISTIQLKDSSVVLSACDTAVGKRIGREGSQSLSTYFRMAGAAQVVASRWRVADSATRVFMTKFYHSVVRQSQPLHTALQQAQEQMAVHDQYRHPHYWAGFSIF